MMQYLLPLVEDCQQVQLTCYAQSKSRVCYMGLPQIFICKCLHGLGLSICGKSDRRMRKQWSLVYALTMRKGEILEMQS